ncbi:Alpha/Beta hydrolase protein [Lophiotrema nucula]|uniref:Alpha/Beta hydrolase protein n=1 Tax=Lophiotrema nucula TaxID=690887 RepID=A0A6A5YML9_9PLEO|nr:Alpha/Beta hydrolase protein [Lophiotrema nucula]
MSDDCCKSGFSWGGKPEGTESTIAKNRTYVTGTSKSAAVLLIHDIFGWTFTNLRLLADHFAKEANATVYVADFFDNEVISEETMDDEAKRTAFDLPAFVGRNSKEIRYPEIKAVAQALKAEYPRVAAIGYCYGAWACLQLGADPSLIDAISVVHGSLCTNEEIDAVKVPVQVQAPETDPQWTPEIREYANKKIPELGVPYDFVYFPGLMHGFAARGDPEKKIEKDGLERAKRSAVNFFNEFLH